MQRSTPNDQRHHFDFCLWCDHIYHATIHTNRDTQRAMKDFVHDVLHDSRQILNVIYDNYNSLSSIADRENSPEDTAEFVEITGDYRAFAYPNIAALKLDTNLKNAVEALEHNAQMLHVYEYENVDGYETIEHMPKLETPEDIINFAQDVVNSVIERGFTETMNTIPQPKTYAYKKWRDRLTPAYEARYPLFDHRSLTA